MLHKIYIKYVRHRIYLINNVEDLIKIFKNINFFYKNITSDKICELIIEGFKLYPLSEEELQKISLLEQNYSNNLGLENYTTCILWLCVIQYIQENILQEINNIKIQITKSENKYNNNNTYKSKYWLFHISFNNPYTIKYLLE